MNYKNAAFMFIEGPLKSGKTALLAQKFTELIEAGASSSQILVITQNSYKKQKFSDTIREKLLKSGINSLGELPIYTFNGVVYNSIKANWPLVEELIPESAGKREIIPNLCGLEVSELLIKNCIKKINKRENLEDTLRDYQSNKNLKHQLLRRLTLITNNSLEKFEISERSKILDEQMGKQAQDVLEELKLLTRNCRTFDYLKQIPTFLYLLENNKINFDKVKYLLVDDYDELTYSAQKFVKILISQVNEFYISADTKGGSRRGYLCANPDGWESLKKQFPFPSETLNLVSKREISEDAEELFSAIKENKSTKLNNISIIENSIRHVEMLEAAFSKIRILLKNEKYSPDDIVLVTPILDGTLKHAINEFFDTEKLSCQFLTGSKKIFDDTYVFGTLIILQLINEDWGFKPKSFEIRSLLTGMLNIPTALCGDILQDYEDTGKFFHFSPKINTLIELIEQLKEEKTSLSTQVEKIFNTLILPNFTENSDISEFVRMTESLVNFEKLAEKTQNKLFFQKEWLILMKDTVVSDNPSSAPELKENSIKIATPQKIIDLEIQSKVQIWLDVSSGNWTKDDTGPLYNAWVFHKNWSGDKYTQNIHNKLTIEKTAHVMRKLALLVDEKIFCYASQLDVSGAENSGGIETFITEAKKSSQVKFEFTPRKDQASALEYTGGKMAISAVPGAGKTKILEALIIKMIQDGINPEDILALTYMDSAARNIRERIKNSCPDLVKFPHISTIHGLALSIIKQGDNYTKLNLDSDFEICDDSLKFGIMAEIYNKFAENQSLGTFINTYTSAISQAKMLDITPELVGKYLAHKNADQYKELFDFYPVYAEYQNILRSRNLIDYDDFLIYSVKLLKEYPDIKKHYQGKFKYIIEDEAQDSSSVQQELFEIISEKHGNLIRCGDPNQAITSSFSNSDLKGFVEFSKTADKVVKMDHSQRCAAEVFELANSLVDWAMEDEALKDAFEDLKIHAVEGKNPETINCLDFKIYETHEEEKSKILAEISKLKRSPRNLTIGILLRGNQSVIEWAEFLEAQSIPFICYSESVAQKKVFRFIKAFMEVLNNPWDNRLVKTLYEEFCKINAVNYKFDALHFLEKAGSPFICFAKDDFPVGELGEFQQEIINWLKKSNLPPEEIISDIGVRYFDSVIDKSNARIISLLVAKHRRYFTDNEQNKTINLPEVIEYLRELSYKKKLSGVKFFNELEKDDDKYEFVQIMTAHKAKGLEFDVVFMPEMQECMFSYPITPEVIRPAVGDLLMNQIRGIKKLQKTADKIKIEQIHEHLRLIYVGITRAKHYLYMSGNQKDKNSWSKSKDFRPSRVLEYFMEMYSKV
jgi:DNA helicase-2/ATP-dependent DNA helicase PcrA